MLISLSYVFVCLLIYLFIYLYIYLHILSVCSSYSHHFRKYQDLSNKGNLAVEQFNIDESLFLAFANKLSDKTFIYKLHNSKFILHQTMDNNDGHDLEYFMIGDKHYLGVAFDYHEAKSAFYQWNGHRFTAFGNISVEGATSLNFFKILSDSFLAAANSYKDSISIYKWKDKRFEPLWEARMLRLLRHLQ